MRLLTSVLSSRRITLESAIFWTFNCGGASLGLASICGASLGLASIVLG